jgi:23S rRNA pseudouridine1911/1915/1917 synthase
MSGLIEYHFVATEEGVRLDKYVSDNCPEVSRSRAKRLIEEGYVRVNTRTAKVSRRLSTGDELRVTVPPPAPAELLPETIPLSIIYEDDDVLVLDKPPGMTVHPAPGNREHTLVNAVLAHFPALADIGGEPRPGIVHRLDKNTSGLMVVAKSVPAQQKLAAQFHRRSVLKVYLVLVKGRITPEAGIIEADIGRDSRNRKQMAVVSRGRPARTEYRVIRYVGGYTLLEVRTHTGRTHQIRVHLAAIGYPVLGDATYGLKFPFLPRQFLHAYRLGFHLPSSGQYVEFTTELPQDLVRALRSIEQDVVE